MKKLIFGALVAVILPAGISPRAFAQDDEEEIVISKEADATVSLDPLVSSAAVWQMTGDQIATAFKAKGFAWLDPKTKDRGLIRPRNLILKDDSNKKTIQYRMMRHKLMLFGSPAYEASLEFSGGKLNSVSISIWNKGDADQPIIKAIYEDLIKKTVSAVNVALAVPGRDLGLDNTAAAKISRWRWESPITLAQLESSAGKDADRQFTAEFIRLRLVPKGASGLESKGTSIAKVSVSSLTGRVKTNPAGDVYIDSVPMVDQGEKGYCAVATTERVMRYYGIQVDQHDLAKAAETSGSGTNPQDFENALHHLQGRFKIRVRDLIHFDDKDYEKMMEVYNREAKKAGARQAKPGDYYFEFNPDIMREARCRAGAFEKFRNLITASTSKGVPLLWALSLGRYPETGHENPQGGGGHMRTIIGYNTKTDEVIFSDSWGAGHEFKRMKGRDACAATLGLYLVEPAG